MTYPTTVLLEPDIKYTILSEDGTPVYVTFTLPRSQSATSERIDDMWDKYNIYTGYVVIALNVCTIAALVAHTIYNDAG